MIADLDAEYHAARARDEAIRAIDAGSGLAAAIHRELCLLHCGKVIAALHGEAAWSAMASGLPVRAE